MTAAERLVALAGQGGTAAALLLAIGVGSTAGELLVSRSGLETATAAEHLLAEGTDENDSSGVEYVVRRRAYRDPLEDEDVLILFG